MRDDLRCVHGERFPCAQCVANRKWNEAATGKKLTDREFEEQYTGRRKDLEQL